MFLAVSKSFLASRQYFQTGTSSFFWITDFTVDPSSFLAASVILVLLTFLGSLWIYSAPSASWRS